MEFKIACETFHRLSHVCAIMPDNETRDWLRYLYVERKGGKLIAVACNAKIAAVELLAKDDAGPDECAHVKFDPALIKQAESESKFNGSLYIASNDILKWTIVKSMFGYVHPSNAGLWPDEVTLVQRWREWFPDEAPEKPYGHMQIKPELIAQLGMSAPSRELVFSATIDSRCPVICRDQVDANWFGLFMPMFGPSDPAPKFVMPKW